MFSRGTGGTVEQLIEWDFLVNGSKVRYFLDYRVFYRVKVLCFLPDPHLVKVLIIASQNPFCVCPGTKSLNRKVFLVRYNP